MSPDSLPKKPSFSPDVEVTVGCLQVIEPAVFLMMRNAMQNWLLGVGAVAQRPLATQDCVRQKISSSRAPGMIAVPATDRVGRMTCRSAVSLSHGVICVL